MAVTRPATTDFRGWRMVAIAFLALNFGSGLSTTSYGPLLSAIQERFETSRSLASMGVSAALLSMCLLSPVIGTFVQRWSIRYVMLAGAALKAAGYVVLAYTHSLYVFLGTYLLVIGPGMATLGIVPGPALVSRWFVRDRGKALGIANMQVSNFIAPLLMSFMLLNYDLKGALLVNAALFLLLMPILSLVVNRPEDIGQQPYGAEDAPAAPAARASLRTADVFRRPEFWLMTLGVGFLMASSITIATHIIPLVAGKGIDHMLAAGVLSAYGMALLPGAVTLGWVSDRLGPITTYAVVAFVAILPWSALIFLPPSIGAYAGVAIMIGLCNGGFVTLHVATSNEIFGAENVGKIIGLGYFCMLPFLFAASPLAGLIYDHTGSYNSAIAAFMGALAAGGLCFTALRFVHLQRHPHRLQQDAASA